MNPAYLVVVGVAIALGLWHLNLALHAIFLFRSGESISSWIAIIVGPLSTLPAAVVALLSKRGGGHWLIFGGVVSILAFAAGELGITANTLQFLLRITAPMVLAGVVIVLVPRDRS